MSHGYRIVNQYYPHFLTFTTVGWVDLFTRKECVQIIRDSMIYCQKNKGLVIHAYVIMSNHLHLVCGASEGGPGLSEIIRDFKKFTSKQLLKWIFYSGKESRKDWLKVVFEYHAKYNSRNKNYQVWQQNNRPMECINSRFTWQKIDYIHHNPVVAGMVEKTVDYLWSSARNYAEMNDCFLDVEFIDFDVDWGYVMR